MHIYNTGTIDDKKGRLCLSGFFGDGETVYFFVEINEKNEKFMYVQNYKEDKIKLSSATLDKTKGRVIIPAWIRDLLTWKDVAVINVESEGGKTKITLIDLTKIDDYSK